MREGIPYRFQSYSSNNILRLKIDVYKRGGGFIHKTLYFLKYQKKEGGGNLVPKSLLYNLDRYRLKYMIKSGQNFQTFGSSADV